MARFSQTSIDRLELVHPLLKELAFTVVDKVHDCTVVYGARTLEEQRVLVAKGASKTMNSKHLIQADGYAHAIDLAAYPIDWNDQRRNYWFAGMVHAVAALQFPPEWRLRWGGNWDMDDDLNDQTFMDLVHFELRRVT